MENKCIHRTSSKNIGVHVIADFWNCKYEDNASKLLSLLINAAHVSNATILETMKYSFDPLGSTAILLLSESHISIHTWPEYHYVGIDIFTCGKSMKPEKAIEYLERALRPTKKDIKIIKRGED